MAEAVRPSPPGLLAELRRDVQRLAGHEPPLDAAQLLEATWARLAREGRLERRAFLEGAAAALRDTRLSHDTAPGGLPPAVAQMDALASVDPRLARVFELRCLAGLDVAQTAELLETLPAAVERDEQRLRALIDVPEDAVSVHELLGGVEATATALPAVLGAYRVLGLAGSGGMGHVYRALDPALGREVAIKAISATFRNDAAGLRRFEREARILAALNHPNIGGILGLERIDGEPYLVLELVAGPTLRERVGQGPLSPTEALDVARQLAAALEEAHAKGVVHRDLKPENVKLTPEGRVKVLDFGLAKSLEAEGATLSERTTISGVILGTAPYMSPEQARGENVDARADVWAFGCVLYEMLTGRHAFPGRHASDVLAAVLRDEPDWSALPTDTPTSLARLLRRCLRKDARQRIPDGGALRLELADLQEPGPVTGRSRSALAPALALGVALAAGLALPWVLVRPGERSAERRPQLSLDLPDGLELATGYAAPFALAPDGSRLALVVRDGESTRLVVRPLDRLEAVPVAGSEGAWQPFFSPDGQALAFFADRKLQVVRLEGGPVTTLAEVGGNPRGGSWGDDGFLVFATSQTSGLSRVSERGGALAVLTTPDRAREESSHRWPQVLPGGRSVLFTVGTEDGSYDDARLDLLDLASGERRTLLERASHGRVVRERLLFVRGGRLLAVGFDGRALRGEPELVRDGIRYEPGNGAAQLDVARDGTLAFRPGRPASEERHLTLVGPDGTWRHLADRPRAFRNPRLSHDGRFAVAAVGPAREAEAWTLDIGSGTLTRLGEGLRVHRPIWRPDGRGVTVAAEAAGRWRLVTLTTGPAPRATLLLEGPDRMYPCDWSSDGTSLVFQQRRREGWDLRRLTLAADGTASPPADLVATAAEEANAAISPDGAWFAYESDELDGIVDVYLRRFPEGDGKLRVSGGGARWPHWGGPDTLLYWSTGARGLSRARLAAGNRAVLAEEAWAPLRPADRAALSRLHVNTLDGSLDVDPRSARVLMLEAPAPAGPEPPRLPVVLPGWASR